MLDAVVTGSAAFDAVDATTAATTAAGAALACVDSAAAATAAGCSAAPARADAVMGEGECEVGDLLCASMPVPDGITSLLTSATFTSASGWLLSTPCTTTTPLAAAWADVGEALASSAATAAATADTEAAGCPDVCVVAGGVCGVAASRVAG